MEGSWHVWVIKQNRLGRVEKFLSETPGIEEWLYPTTTKEYRLQNGTFRKRRVPLYSGYLFIKYVSSAELHHKLNSQPFFTTYRGTCSERDVKIVRELGELEVINTSSKSFQLDDLVKINSGPFKDMEGSITEINSTTIKVDINVFGRAVHTSFSKDDVDIIKRVNAC